MQTGSLSACKHNGHKQYTEVQRGGIYNPHTDDQVQWLLNRSKDVLLPSTNFLTVKLLGLRQESNIQPLVK